MRPHIVIGQQFGRWTVTGLAPTRKTPRGYYLVYWLCVCSCGAERQVQQRHLLSGRTVSCGCWRRQAAAERMTTHGGRDSALYDVWTQMLQRCNNQTNKRYARYGGRGVAVCPEWHDFAAFQAWALANGYAAGLTLDREENDGDYAPGNCRWVPSVTNSRNNSVTLKVTWDGVKVPLNTLAEFHGLNPNTVYSRYKLKGWTLREALGLDAAPRRKRTPYGPATRQRMRDAALVREQRKREVRT